MGIYAVVSMIFRIAGTIDTECAFYGDGYMSHRVSTCRWQSSDCGLTISAGADDDDDDDFSHDDDPIEQFSDHDSILSIQLTHFFIL